MSKRPPLKEQDILDVCERYADNYPIEGRITVNSMAMRRAVEPLVEAARAKDGELIQQLVDAIHMLLTSSALKRGMRDVYMGDNNSGCAHYGNKAIAAAEAAGFKPSQP